MSRFILCFLTILMLMIMGSCSPEHMTREQLRKFMNDESNGVKKMIEDADGLKLEVYLIRPELINESNTKFVSSNTAKYFLLNFSKDGHEALLQYAGQHNYAQLFNNLTFNAPRYCRLIINGNDTIRASNFLFSNQYGTSSSNNLLMVFDKVPPTSDIELDVDELGFNSGDKKFFFKVRDIKDYYHIKLIR